ncbi:thioredoxin family protein [bacterium]|nr:thioredoxin family protein [bacterium]MBU1989365.1 thioredoxin family protein [bacterium]
MRNLLIWLMIFLGTAAFSSEINWAKDFPAGIQEAAKQNKPVLFVFSRHSCKYCVILDETTFKDERVITALNRDFVSIISYSDENDYTPRELFTPGTPALWFLLPSGQPMFQPLMGAVDAENFLKALAIVKEEFDSSKKQGK